MLLYLYMDRVRSHPVLSVKDPVVLGQERTGPNEAERVFVQDISAEPPFRGLS